MGEPYTRPVTPARFRELASSIISYAAQLVYAGKTAEAYRLLSAADRLLRHLGGSASPEGAGEEQLPLADEITAAKAFLETSRISRGLAIELVVDLDEETQSSSFIGCGSLVDRLDALVAGFEPACGAIRLVLAEDEDGGKGPGLRAGEPRLSLTVAGRV